MTDQNFYYTIEPKTQAITPIPLAVTLRDQFAMAALTGLLANPKLQPEILKTGGAYGGWIEGSAWSWADAMMEKRK